MFDFDETYEPDFRHFLDVLLNATRNIGIDYFQVLVAGGEDPIYRERVYCYELYHCIRELMGGNFYYQLDGELDKAGHPLIHKYVGSVKPDFLVHWHGEMNKNLVVVEVKPINAATGGIDKDITTLCNFLKFAHYYRAIYLIYGEDDDIDKFLGVVKEKVTAVPESSFYFLWHKQYGNAAEIIWSNQ
jgi:hypothetical protein